MSEINLNDLLAQRVVACRRDARAYSYWVGILTPLKWLCVGGGVVLPAVAGFSLLGRREYLGQQWQVISGALALAGSLLMGLHVGFKCDPYQAECHRLIQAFEALAKRSESAAATSKESVEKAAGELEAKYAELTETAQARPPRWAQAKARRQLA